MSKPISWMDRARRRDTITAVGLVWAFLGIPAAMFATKIDGTLGWIVIGLAIAPIAAMGAVITAFAVLAPFLARKPTHRMIAIPATFFLGYALGDIQGALAFPAAVVIAWAAIAAWQAISPDKVRLPS